MLPRVDDVLPAESDGAFEAHQRFFSFSNATLQSDEYMRLRDDPETCVSNMELGVRDAFYLSGKDIFREKLQDRGTYILVPHTDEMCLLPCNLDSMPRFNQFGTLQRHSFHLLWNTQSYVSVSYLATIS